MRSSAYGVVVFIVLSGCPDDSGGGGETEASTGDATMGSMSSPTSAASMSTSSSTSNSTTDATSTESGEQTTTTGMPDTTTESGEASSTTAVAMPCDGMSFFATSVGSGRNGGDLGGVEGADATCQALAEAVGQGACTWHAYLSSSTEDARDRIGAGPWLNYNLDMIAADVDALHEDGLSNGDPQHVFDENGNEVPGQEHDILTGSQEDGTLLPDTTCDDWTSSTSEFMARVGHSDIPANPDFSPSWNSAHTTPGCSPGDLDGVGGAGRLYCFAI